MPERRHGFLCPTGARPSPDKAVDGLFHSLRRGRGCFGLSRPGLSYSILPRISIVSIGVAEPGCSRPRPVPTAAHASIGLPEVGLALSPVPSNCVLHSAQHFLRQP